MACHLQRKDKPDGSLKTNYTLPMTKDQTHVGTTIRVVASRYDAPVRTIARIEHIGTVGVGQVWCFTVRWLNRERSARSKSDTSLNLFEEDLADFDVYTGPIEVPKKDTQIACFKDRDVCRLGAT